MQPPPRRPQPRQGPDPAGAQPGPGDHPRERLPLRPVPDLRLIVVTDARLAGDRGVERTVALALEAGAPAIQLRDKHAHAADLLRQATRLRDLTRAHHALLFINDRIDVALAAEADGVHLGPDDLPVAAARRAADRYTARAAPFYIGYSSDDPARARDAADAGADYIGCGAVFGTRSKDVGDERIGTQALAAVAQAVHIPVIAIGGITPANAPRIPPTGAAGVAVVGAVMEAHEVGAAVSSLLGAFV